MKRQTFIATDKEIALIREMYKTFKNCKKHLPEDYRFRLYGVGLVDHAEFIKQIEEAFKDIL